MMLEFHQRERLRLSYRPEAVRLLFVGESPPASGRFFYRGDSGLYRAMREAFQIADRAIGDEAFLTAFQAAGCYLIDLCPEPVDDLDSKSRRAARLAGEASLCKAIAQMWPSMIATLLRSIEGNVASVVSDANWSGKMIHLPYPGRWSHHKDAFVRGIVPPICELLHERR
jgi:hypothetical protein